MAHGKDKREISAIKRGVYIYGDSLIKICEKIINGILLFAVTFEKIAGGKD